MNEIKLEFDSENHQYSVGENKIISVSNLISIFGNDSDFDSDMLEIPLEVARERGTFLHLMLKMILEKQNIENEYPSSYSGYIESIFNFLENNNIFPISLETPIYSEKMQIAGTPDILCMFSDDENSEEELTIIDYKFVSQVCKPKVKAQLNAYRRIYEEQGIDVTRLIAVQFFRDGTYRKYECAIDDTEVDLALSVQDVLNKKHSRGRID